LAENITKNNKITKLVDAYRTIHSNNGFTWKRGIIYSRLDYVFISESIVRNIADASIDWVFDTSDHAAVIIDVEINDEGMRGPGMTRINIKMLDDPKIASKIGVEIVQMLQQAGEQWNPHMKLEYLKVAIRTVFSKGFRKENVGKKLGR
jgi:hypothetical protein